MYATPEHTCPGRYCAICAAARNRAHAAIANRGRQNETVHAAAIATRTALIGRAQSETACNPDKCATAIDGACDVHRRATPAQQCLGHRHNRK